MQAAATRSASVQRLRRSDRVNSIPPVAAADDHALLHALPIAAAIFSLKGEKLWVEMMNSRYLELAGCDGTPEKFAEVFKRYADGPGGRLTREFLLDPAGAPDE